MIHLTPEVWAAVEAVLAGQGQGIYDVAEVGYHMHFQAEASARLSAIEPRVAALEHSLATASRVVVAAQEFMDTLSPSDLSHIPGVAAMGAFFALEEALDVDAKSTAEHGHPIGEAAP